MANLLVHVVCASVVEMKTNSSASVSWPNSLLIYHAVGHICNSIV